jgi:hypothetical protein
MKKFRAHPVVVVFLLLIFVLIFVHSRSNSSLGAKAANPSLGGKAAVAG